MKKIDEYTGRFVDVVEIGNIYRSTDKCLYTLYKSKEEVYYLDAYDAAPSVARFGEYESDVEALAAAQRFIDGLEG